MTDSNDKLMDVFDILALPEESLLHVFSFLDHDSCNECALVCKSFYEMVCEAERDQYRVCITNEMVRDQIIK